MYECVHASMCGGVCVCVCVRVRVCVHACMCVHHCIISDSTLYTCSLAVTTAYNVYKVLSLIIQWHTHTVHYSHS